MRAFFISILALLLFVSIPAAAQNNTKESQKTFKGYLIDRMCGSTMTKKGPEKAMMMATKHTRECAMEDACAASGYGLMFDGTWHAFNDAGTKKAASYLKTNKMKSHIYVEVTGEKKGDVIDVASIMTAKEPMTKKNDKMKMDNMKMKKMN